MSDALVIAAEAETAAAAALLPREQAGRTAAAKRLKVIAIVAVGLVCAFGLAAGAGAAIVGARPAQVELAVDTPVSFYALPDLTATLAPEGKWERRARIAVSFEVEDAHLAQVKAQAAAIVAATEEHLLDLHPADLAGRKGAENLRAFIREAVDARIAPGIVRNILFTSFLID